MCNQPGVFLPINCLILHQRHLHKGTKYIPLITCKVCLRLGCASMRVCLILRRRVKDSEIVSLPPGPRAYTGVQFIKHVLMRELGIWINYPRLIECNFSFLPSNIVANIVNYIVWTLLSIKWEVSNSKLLKEELLQHLIQVMSAICLWE